MLRLEYKIIGSILSGSQVMGITFSKLKFVNHNQGVKAKKDKERKDSVGGIIVLMQMRTCECELCCKVAYIEGRRWAARHLVIRNVLKLGAC
jgi:hypothetical protein